MRETPQLYRMQAIIETVCDYYRVRPDQMRRRDRRKKYILPRQVAIYFLRGIIKDELPLWSFNEIASNVGISTHSTVIHANKKVVELMNADHRILNDIENISELLEVATYSEGFRKEYKRNPKNVDMTSDSSLIIGVVKTCFPESEGFLTTNSKQVIYTMPRAVCVYLLKSIRYTNNQYIWTNKQIADMSNVGSSTVMSYVDMVEQELFVKGKYAKNIKQAIKLVEAIDFQIPVIRTYKRK